MAARHPRTPPQPHAACFVAVTAARASIQAGKCGRRACSFAVATRHARCRRCGPHRSRAWMVQHGRVRSTGSKKPMAFDPEMQSAWRRVAQLVARLKFMETRSAGVALTPDAVVDDAAIASARESFGAQVSQALAGIVALDKANSSASQVPQPLLLASVGITRMDLVGLRKGLQKFHEISELDRDTRMILLETYLGRVTPAHTGVGPLRAHDHTGDRMDQHSLTELSSLPPADLYAHPNFRALPYVQPLAGRPERNTLGHVHQPFAPVSQHSAGWLECRKTVHYTASSMADALGFMEQRAAKVLGARCMPLSHVDRTKTLDAWLRAQDPYTFDSQRVKVARSAAQQRRQFYLDWGKRHEANGLLAFLRLVDSGAIQPNFPPGRLSEAGLYLMQQDMLIDEAERYFIKPDRPFPLLGASPDAIWYACDTSAGAPAPGDQDTAPQAIVEVKCRVPFAPGKNGGWIPIAVQPHSSLLATHFVQLQCQMLCTGTRVAYLVSHALDEQLGDCVRVFMVPRDSEWIGLALGELQDIFLDFVLPGIPPDADFYVGAPASHAPAQPPKASYVKLLERTRESAASAVVVYEPRAASKHRSKEIIKK
ncbi:hypothetical protein FVE85_5726 [Porphyridium purpureum]|uniref:Uncharacterized protein n=1 Tax=Porphyridium purpureum TaxID=35688 RepID=A0A5J4Z2R9_PORPP|nr:hypothetical protein FVE85_5726 [Porphyridium purpureum]|eukprot:POR4785..scf295_1